MPFPRGPRPLALCLVPGLRKAPAGGARRAGGGLEKAYQGAHPPPSGPFRGKEAAWAGGGANLALDTTGYGIAEIRETGVERREAVCVWQCVGVGGGVVWCGG
jgi:hypothetical protein